MRPLALLIIDVFVVATAAVCALLLRDNLEIVPGRLAALQPYVVFAVLAALVVFPIAATNRGFWRYSTLSDLLRIVLAASIVVLAATTAMFAYNRLDGLARSIPILHLLLIISLMGAARVTMRIRHHWRARPEPVPALGAAPKSERVLVIGMNAVSELFLRSVQQYAKETIHVVGLLGRNDRHRGRLLHGVPVLGLPDELAAVLRRLQVHGVDVDRIVVAAPPSELTQAARDALAAIEDGSGVIVDYFGERLGLMPPHVAAADALDKGSYGPLDDGSMPSLRQIVDEGVASRPYWMVKRALDVLGALAAIVATAPLMLIVAVAVAIDMGTPVLFWQERPGRFGRRLKLYKFRTMKSAHDREGRRVPDSERLPLLGRMLRRTRLDELPQLFNVLLGEMSFIGPRPLLPIDQAPEYAGRLAVRPGLTGWAQVHGGRDVNAADKAVMDLWYVKNASFWVDCVITLKTALMLISGERENLRVIAEAWRDIGVWMSSREPIAPPPAYPPTQAARSAA